MFANRLDPERTGKQLSRDEFDALWKTLVDMLHIGVKYNRIITADVEVGKPLSRLNRSERLLCYKQEHCPRCDLAIESWELGGRRNVCLPGLQQ